MAAVFLLAFTTGGGSFAAEVEVTACGQAYRGKGFLSADLDCTGFGGNAVLIQRRGSLDLQGFTLTGGDGDGVRCDRSCKIIGPGTITGSGGFGVRAEGNVRVENVTVTDNGGIGIKGFVRAKVENSMVTGNGQCGISGRSVKTRGTVASDNGYRGVCAAKMRMRGCAVTGNGVGGIYSAYRPRVLDSNITDNGTVGECPPQFNCPFSPPFVDVRSCDKPPALRNTICGTSGTCESSPPTWGVCSND